MEEPYLGQDAPPEVLAPGFLEPRDKSAALAGTEAHARKERGELFPDLWRDGRHEVSFSYDCRTGEVEVMQLNVPDADGFVWTADERDEWKASRGPDCVTGTTDWWGSLDDCPNWIDDLKTGRAVPAIKTPAMLFYALCAHDLNPGPVRLSITHWPRCKGEPKRLWADLSELELEAFRLDLESAWELVSKDREPRSGPWCQWCPSAAWCPEVGG